MMYQTDFRNPADFDRMMRDTHTFPLRQYNTVIMGLGAIFFALLFVGGAWSSMRDSHPIFAIVFGLFGLFLASLPLYMIREGKSVYTVSPEQIRFTRPKKAPIAIPWTDVSDFTLDRDINEGWVLQLKGPEDNTVRMEAGIPRFQLLAVLVQSHIAKNGHKELVERVTAKYRQDSEQQHSEPRR